MRNVQKGIVYIYVELSRNSAQDIALSLNRELFPLFLGKEPSSEEIVRTSELLADDAAILAVPMSNIVNLLDFTLSDLFITRLLVSPDLEQLKQIVGQWRGFNLGNKESQAQNSNNLTNQFEALNPEMERHTDEGQQAKNNDLTNQLNELFADLKRFIDEGRQAGNAELTKRLESLAAQLTKLTDEKRQSSYEEQAKQIEILRGAVERSAKEKHLAEEERIKVENDKKERENDNAELRRLLAHRSSTFAVVLTIAASLTALLAILINSFEVLVIAAVIGAVGLGWGGYRLFKPERGAVSHGQ